MHEVNGTGKTRAAARRELLDQVDELKAVHGTGALRGDDPATALVRAWQASTRWSDLAANSHKTYTSSLRNHVLPAVAHLRVVDLTTPALQSVVDRTVTGAGYTAGKTVRAILKDLGSAGVRAGIWAHSPAEHLVLPRRAAKPVKAALGPADLALLISRTEAAGGVRMAQLRKLFILLAATGCRPGEALALRWEDVDLGAGVVSFSGTMIRTDEAGHHRQDDTKSKRDRAALLPPAAVVELSTWVGESERRGPLIPSRVGTHVELNNMGTSWRKVRSPGYEDYQLRDVRAAVGTAVAEGEGVWAAARRLGHSDAGVTAAHYVARGVTAEGLDAVELLVSGALGRVTPDVEPGETGGGGER
ncbi:tyrosine-type recombinase/integrase [Kocuria arenosa]|uniref:tyrosine-type recombinase/integrase n=1 Tax=Kocuria arenosa TaxID=3071446 RepID=UPI0034D58FB6